MNYFWPLSTLTAYPQKMYSPLILPVYKHFYFLKTWKLVTVIINRLKKRVKKKDMTCNKHIRKRYGDSQQLRFVDGYALVPIGYVQTRNPMYKKMSICKYTPEGRQEIHKSLQFDEYVSWVMEQLQYNYTYTDIIEFTDNKISLYAAQYGKCAVLGVVLDIDDIHCHHKLPKKLGKTTIKT